MFAEVVKDFGLASILLFLGYGLRAKIKMFQKLYIPAAVIGGILGLLLSGAILGQFSPMYLSFSENVASYSMPLLAGVFCTRFFGVKLEKKMLRDASAIGVLNILCILVQVLLGIGIVYLFCMLTGAEVPLGMGILPFAGFYGGHGIPAVFGVVFEGANYWTASEATSIGNTFATFGLIYGIVGGIAIINIAVRKGLVSSNAGTGNLSDEELSGYVEPEKQTAALKGITKGAVLNPASLHVGIVLAVLYLGYIAKEWVNKVPGMSNMAVTGVAMIVGLIVAVIVGRTGLKKYIDGESLSNVSGVCLEYLIVTSLSTTNLSVFMNYGALILLLTVILLPLTTFMVLYLARKWQKENWVENAVGTFGLATGVLATGFLLVRIADPDMKTDASLNLAGGSLISGLVIQSYYLNFFPSLLISNPTAAVGITTVLTVGFFVVGLVAFRNRSK